MSVPSRCCTVNLGMQTVTMAVFDRAADGGITLSGYARTGLVADPGADASRAGQMQIALNELKASAGWKRGIPVACAIPSQGVFARFVKIPKTEPDAVGQVLHFEAQQNVPYPIEEVSWAYQLLPESDPEKLGALLIATKREQLEETVEVLAGAGLTPSLVDTSPVALCNAFFFNYPDVEGCSLVIDIGSRATNLLFIEGRQLFIRTLPVGGSSITAAMQKKFEGRSFNECEQMKCAGAFIPPPGNYDVGDADSAEMGKTARTVMTRVHNEITRSITFYRTNQRGSAPMRAFLAGGGVSLPYTLEFFNEKLSLPIEYFNPLRRVSVGPGVDTSALAGAAHSLGECTGLALRQLLGNCPLEIDLKAPSLEAAEKNRARRPYLAAAAALLVGTLLVAGLSYDRAARRIAALNAEISGQSASLSKFKAELDDLTGERRKLMEDAADLAAVPMLRTAWASLLDELNTRLPARNIWVTKLRPQVGEATLEPAEGKAGWQTPEKTEGTEPSEPAAAVTALVVDGLYLESENGPAVVDEFVEALAESPLFGITAENKASVVQLRATQSGEAWAYDYKLVLPLARPIPL